MPEGLSTARVHLLWALGQSGPSTQRALASALGVTPRNVTDLVDGLVDGLIDGLVTSGHLTREPHPDDRRATLVTPTDHGLRTVEALVESHADFAQQLFGDVPADRLASFLDVLADTTRRFARLMEAA